MTLKGLIDTASTPAELDLLNTTLLGVPLIGWAMRNLRLALPADQISVQSTDQRVMDYATARGVRAEAAGASGQHETILRADPLHPFCTAAAAQASLASSGGWLHDHARSAVEKIQLRSQEDVELAEALCRGLPPDHSCLQGIRRYRLPFRSPIRAVISDVDGCLTDGGITHPAQGGVARTFNTKDGIGHNLLHQAGLVIGWLSATGDGDSVLHRAANLAVEAVDVGRGDKGPRFTALCARLGVEPGSVLYLGDDINDLPAMDLAGYSACPADAVQAVRTRVDCLLETPGGEGCFREAAEIVLDRIHP